MLRGGVFRGACMYVASAGILVTVNMRSHPASLILCVPIVRKQSFLVAGRARIRRSFLRFRTSP